ncbi:N-acetylgalactosamine-N,N'-diacetylbacillosaminyl-diphospho-undecaprenol 4-alpha-N-acetylgalactosaminyltransferase [Arenibacter antarcticus]|uniref:Glycosyltransferase n=1 Tax=Arenibacter antarcticus TaxID=2040469 RepID=A0ABW5VFW6_9FLAO|nr:glycosyltransferase [Arenibacter sp. H213]MCM4167334.1 glycosyltransferase [Arenibacter sp. H213]
MKRANLSILAITLGSGGAEKVISLLLKKLVLDYNVTLILMYNNIHFTIPEGVNTIVLCPTSSRERPFYIRFFDSISFIFRYNRIIREEGISYAVSFLALPNLMNGVISKLNPSVKTYISERGFPSKNTTHKISFYISKFFYPLLYNKCYKLFSNSIHINKDLKDNFNIKIPMEVIYNPIEIPEKIIVPESLKLSASGLKIITVGSLNENKNHIIILKAIASLGEKYSLTIAGTGNLQATLKENSAQLGLNGNVNFTGLLKDVNSYLLQANCFVLSSFNEGFPNALLEAMSIGLPCISTNCLSGPLEILNDNIEIEIPKSEFYKAEFGILINSDDEIGLAKALKYLNTNPTERVRYSKKSLERAKRYNIDNIYNEFREFIQN